MAERVVFKQGQRWKNTLTGDVGIVIEVWPASAVVKADNNNRYILTVQLVGVHWELVNESP